MSTTRILAVLVLVLAAASPARAVPVTFTQISTTFSNPIGIDYHSPTNSVITSVNYPGGFPHNFERINFDGTHTAFSTIAGFTEEVKIATARPGNPGGWAAGTLFTGNGNDGEIVQIAPDGSSFTVHSLPGAGNGLMRGSLYVDRTGTFGGDLIVVTTNGEVWRLDSAGNPTFIADVNTHLEGVITVPNDVAKYGPLAGKIIAGAEEQGVLYVFAADGTFTTYNVGVAIEDIDLIPANENFFGVNYGTGRILGAPASEFTSLVGDILLTQEFGGASGLFALSWDGSSLVTDAITLGAGSAVPGQWEHVTFAPAGIREIPPTSTVPEPATMALLVLGAAGIGAARRRARR